MTLQWRTLITYMVCKRGGYAPLSLRSSNFNALNLKSGPGSDTIEETIEGKITKKKIKRHQFPKKIWDSWWRHQLISPLNWKNECYAFSLANLISNPKLHKRKSNSRVPWCSRIKPEGTKIFLSKFSKPWKQVFREFELLILFLDYQNIVFHA